MLYGPYNKSLKSWDDSGDISSTSTATIIALCESAKEIRIWGYTHMNVAVMWCQNGVCIFVGSSNVVWTQYQVFEELGWHLRHFIHLNCHHHCTLWKCQNQNLLGVYSHECCCNVMPQRCLYIFVGSSNVVWTQYIKSLKSWDDSGDISSTSTATIIALCESAKIRIWGYTHMNVAVMWCHNGVCISL